MKADLYRSTDDGHLYLRSHVDDTGAFDLLEVNDPVVLTPEQLCASDDLATILVQAGQARLVREGR